MQQLSERGHQIAIRREYTQEMGHGQAILHDSRTGTNYAASDPRADRPASATPEPVRPAGDFFRSRRIECILCGSSWEVSNEEIRVFVDCGSGRPGLRLDAGTDGRPSVTASGPTVDPGVARASLMDRAEIRVLRVEIQPGAVRTVHTHDEVRYPADSADAGRRTDDRLREARSVPAGHVVFLEKGTPHGFRNTGSSVAKVLEVFVKPDKPNTPVARTGDPAADKGDAEMLARALALVNTAPSEK